MKAKHFHIRLNKEDLQQDEDRLNEFLPTVVVKKTATQVITSGQTSYWSIIVFYDDISTLETHHTSATEKQPSFDPSTLTGEERNRYEALRTWRADEAAKDNFPNYIIASNAQLGAIAKLNPSTKDELNNLKGFREKKAIKYGDEIIAVLNSI
jgi:superfamily II DNA helicase RecQ